MVAARKQMAGNQAARSSSTNGAESSKNGENVEKRPTSNYNYDEAVLKVQEWNEALKCMHSNSRDVVLFWFAHLWC